MSALSLDASSGSSQQSASIDANLPAKQPPTIAIPSGQSATIAMKSSTTGMMKLPATVRYDMLNFCLLPTYEYILNCRHSNLLYFIS